MALIAEQTLNEAIELAKTVQNFAEMKSKHRGMYNRIFKEGIQDQVRPYLSGARTKWTKSKVIMLAKSYANAEALREDHPRAYTYSIDNGFKDELIASFNANTGKVSSAIARKNQRAIEQSIEASESAPEPEASLVSDTDEAAKDDNPSPAPKRRRKQSYTLHELVMSAKPFEYLGDWRVANRNPHDYAKKHNLLDKVIEIAQLNPSKKPRKVKYTPSSLKTAALKYPSYNAWTRADRWGHQCALKFGVTDELQALFD